MTQGTTPTITCRLQAEIDLTQAGNVYLTLRQGGRTVTKSGGDLTIEESSVGADLTQEDTLLFRHDAPVHIQLNWTYGDGTRGASEIVTVMLGRNLLPEVLP